METRSVRYVLALAIMMAGLAIASQFGISTGALTVLAVAVMASALITISIPAEIIVREVTPPPPPEPVTGDWLAHPDFARFMAGMPNPTLIVGDGSVLAANAPALELLGTHIVGEDVRTAIRHPAASERLTQDDDQVGVSDLVGLGRGQHWEMRTIPLTGGQRIVILSDLSAVETAERMRTDFVANASHELRTPLAALVGFIETLMDTEAGEDIVTRNRFLAVMAKEARRMRQLVDDLISLSRIEADKNRAPSDRVDLVTLTRQSIDEIASLGSGSAARFILEAEDALPMVKASASQLSQLLHNLLGNAVKYGRPDGMILVSIGRNTPSMVQLRVNDEGDGIAPEHLPRLTERFYRVDTARSRVLGGTGLGLSIVKHIVERHKGRLDITSVQGKGTTVAVALPIWQDDSPVVSSTQTLSTGK